MSRELFAAPVRIPPKYLLRFKRIIARFRPFSNRFLHPKTGGIMATQPLPNNDNLVIVFDSMDESEVLVVKSLLEGERIECLMTGEVPMDTLPGVGGWVLQVPAEQAEDARRLIEEERRQPLAEDVDFNEESTLDEEA